MSAPGMKITNFHYSHMKLPDSDPNPSEYPKWVYDKPMSKNGRMVANAEEEAAFLAGLAGEALMPEEVVPPTPAVVLTGGEMDEKAILLALAKEKGIKVDARWKVEKIRAAMEQAQPQVESET